MNRHWYLCGLHFKFSWRRKSGWPGRFGGGWNWKLGVQAGSGTVLFSLLVAEFIVERR